MIMARVIEEERAAQVIVPDYQLSLAIGKEGQNARLAAKLTGYKIDIKCQSQVAGDMFGEGEGLFDLPPVDEYYDEDDFSFGDMPEEDSEIEE